MKIVRIFPVAFFAALLFACGYDGLNSIGISHFRKPLRPYRTKIVNHGIVEYDSATRFVDKHMTDPELKDLSQSEHPVLRAIAFREMLTRPSFDHFDLIMNHLNDTAIVATDAGEWGIRFVRIADDILNNGKWKDTASRNKTVDAVLFRHNYLRSAYRIIPYLEPRQKYYQIIKQMAGRKIPDHGSATFTGQDYQVNFYDLESALCALAKFKQPEDIPLIKKALLSNISWLQDRSFTLMKQYPSEAYLEVFERYYPRQFYAQVCRSHDISPAVAFVQSIATYKDERSAKILDQILSRQPFMPCAADTVSLKAELVESIWTNPCPAYLELRKKVAPLERKMMENEIPLPPVTQPTTRADSSAESVRWF